MHLKRNWPICFILLFVLNLLMAQDVAEGKRLYFSGDLKAAIEKLSGPRPSIESLLWLSLATEENADIRGAITVFEKTADWQSFVPLLNRVGEAEYAAAHYKRARVLFEQSVSKNSKYIPANYNLGRMLFEWGERQAAEKYFNRIISIFQETPYPNAQLTHYTAKACIYLKRFNDANDLLHDAYKLDSKDWRVLVDWGKLFLSKYNYSEAEATFADALKINEDCVPAKIGIARAGLQQNAEMAFKMLEDLQNKHPEDKRVLAIAAEFNSLAGKTELAAKNIQKALNQFPNDLQLLTLSALTSLSEKKVDKFEKIASRILKINPAYSHIWTAGGDHLARTYLFKESVDFYRKALAINPLDTQARSGLGTALSRLAKLDEAKAELEISFREDAYNLWTGNLLNLFDSYVDYDTLKTAHFIIRMHKEDKPIIGAYAAELAEKAYSDYQLRYKFEFDFPITIEIFPKHDDFAVRCFGLPGSQVFLGICFGPLVTMNSPRARPVGSFNWQETLWHELAHVIHLTLSNNRIPRWLAEGVAVWEATRAKKSWSMNMELSIIRALREKSVIPLSDLNKGFASNPARVMFSYYQSSLMVEFIHEQFGMPAIISLFDAFKKDKSTALALRSILKLDEKQFDAAFLSWLKKKYSYPGVHFVFDDGHDKPQTGEKNIDYSKRLAKDSTDFYALLHVGEQKLSAGDEKGVTLLQKSIQLFPEYVSQGNGYWLLANYYFKQKKFRKAAQYLKELTDRNGENFEANIKMRIAAQKLGDSSLEALAYENIIAIYPYDATLHRNWGKILLKNGKYNAAIREFSIELALQPADLAGVHYRLARACVAAKQNKKARLHALKALEIAPTFAPAQKILLQSKKALN